MAPTARPSSASAVIHEREEPPSPREVSRRMFLRLGAGFAGAVGLSAAGAVLGPSLSQRGLLSADGLFGAASIAVADSIYTEVWPTSPLVLSPFTDELPIPKALAPVSDPGSLPGGAPGPGPGQQSSLNNERHQLWPTDRRVGYPDPIVYRIQLQTRAHSFTTSKVRPVKADGTFTNAFDTSGRPVTVGAAGIALPPSTIYGFNGTFPGPMINAEYGRPVLVRFANDLEDNPLGLDRGDFGTHDLSFLTHLHNAHTAPESDGNPHYSMRNGPKYEGYRPGEWCDNLYLNWPAGGDDREKQSFFWFHDHRMDQTGSNVYKGMVGLYPIYDPVLDPGDETRGLRLPGKRTDRPDGAFDVQYDIPLALYDCRLDDGVTTHHDIHDAEFPESGNRAHPEWWGTTFFKHFPNHGFVGDVFTVNGVAYPTLRVKRRKYRLRFLDASIARVYELQLMTSTKGPVAARDLGLKDADLQGQYRIPDGQQCMKWLQIASDGGLVPFAFTRDSFELWPAKRREMVVDFSRYMDGSPTSDGDVIYLTNVMKMPDGRMWSNSSRFSPDREYKVPIMKIVIEGPEMVEDNSVVSDGRALRALPPLPSNWQSMLDNRMIFELQRGSAGGEAEWLINGEAFDPSKPAASLKNRAGKTPLAQQKVGSFNLWEIRNGGGGWVHPMHLHMEEHRVVMRNNRDVTARNGSPGHPDDYSREDLVALDPSESVIIYRGFRDFTGQYVAHCHNLAHEDHAMMFGWEITP
ncbi:multicopper oxidase family protein [Geodermatophilus sp. SYSU D00815]